MLTLVGTACRRRIHLPVPLKTQRTSTRCVFVFKGGGGNGAAVNDAKRHGVEPPGSTSQSDVRERSEGNPPPSAI